MDAADAGNNGDAPRPRHPSHVLPTLSRVARRVTALCGRSDAAPEPSRTVTGRRGPSQAVTDRCGRTPLTPVRDSRPRSLRHSPYSCRRAAPSSCRRRRRHPCPDRGCPGAARGTGTRGSAPGSAGAGPSLSRSTWARASGSGRPSGQPSGGQPSSRPHRLPGTAGGSDGALDRGGAMNGPAQRAR